MTCMAESAESAFSKPWVWAVVGIGVLFGKFLLLFQLLLQDLLWRNFVGSFLVIRTINSIIKNLRKMQSLRLGKERSKNHKRKQQARNGHLQQNNDNINVLISSILSIILMKLQLKDTSKLIHKKPKPQSHSINHNNHHKNKIRHKAKKSATNSSLSPMSPVLKSQSQMQE